MPINLIDYTDVEEGQKGRVLGELGRGIWEIPSQVVELEKWLNETGSSLPKGDYVADLGFSPRDGALGGGAVISPRSMGIMAKIGMSLFLSEYPADN